MRVFWGRMTRVEIPWVWSWVLIIVVALIILNTCASRRAFAYKELALIFFLLRGMKGWS